MHGFKSSLVGHSWIKPRPIHKRGNNVPVTIKLGHLVGQEVGHHGPRPLPGQGHGAGVVVVEVSEGYKHGLV